MELCFNVRTFFSALFTHSEVFFPPPWKDLHSVHCRSSFDVESRISVHRMGTRRNFRWYEFFVHEYCGFLQIPVLINNFQTENNG